MGLSMRNFSKFFQSIYYSDEKITPVIAGQPQAGEAIFVSERFPDKQRRNMQSGLAMRCFLQNILAN
jgi:hypothetical protein